MSEYSSNSSTSEEEDNVDDVLVFKHSEGPNKRLTSETELATQRRNRTLAIASVSLAAASETKPVNDKEDEVDDTDGLDPEQEFTEWQSRERGRVEREFKEIQAKEAEIEARMKSRAKRVKNSED